MPYREIIFQNGSYYHIFNRGVDKGKIFSQHTDYLRFMETIFYYQFSGPKPRFSTRYSFKSNQFEQNSRIIEVIAYCLMPNHFHLLIKQLVDGGLSEFVSKLSNSYTKYFNTKYNRVGPLFQGEFKAVDIRSDEQLVHLSRYIHLNPYVSNLTPDAKGYPYSSYIEFLGVDRSKIVNPLPVLELFPSKVDYEKFINEHQDYALQLEQIKHLVLEED